MTILFQEDFSGVAGTAIKDRPANVGSWGVSSGYSANPIRTNGAGYSRAAPSSEARNNSSSFEVSGTELDFNMYVNPAAFSFGSGGSLTIWLHEGPTPTSEYTTAAQVQLQSLQLDGVSYLRLVIVTIGTRSGLVYTPLYAVTIGQEVRFRLSLTATEDKIYYDEILVFSQSNTRTVAGTRSFRLSVSTDRLLLNELRVETPVIIKTDFWTSMQGANQIDD